VKKLHSAISRAKTKRAAKLKQLKGERAAPILAAPPASIPKSGEKTESDKETEKSTGKRRWEIWKTGWAFLGPIVGLITFWYNFTPSLMISAGSNIDKTQRYSTQVIITNTGRVPIYDLTFTCGFIFLTEGQVWGKHMKFDIQDKSPVPRLNPGEPIGKACASQSELEGNAGLGLSFKVNFRWPFIGYWPLIGGQDSKTAFFEVKSGHEGYFLVPSGSPDGGLYGRRPFIEW
jgi:hypothetical protein